jgi:hypothetical protein
VLPQLFAIAVAVATAGNAFSTHEDSGLEFRVLSVRAGTDGTEIAIQLRWTDPRSIWRLKRKEVIYVGKWGKDEVEHGHEVVFPQEFLTKKDSGRLTIHLEQKLSAGDLVSVQLGCLTVVGVASASKKP